MKINFGTAFDADYQSKEESFIRETIANCKAHTLVIIPNSLEQFTAWLPILCYHKFSFGIDHSEVHKCLVIHISR